MIRELEADEIALSFDAMRALRTHLIDESSYVAQVREQIGDGYRLLGAFDGERVVAVAGFRFATNLAWGRYCYIDDLSVLPESRGAGHAYRLVERVKALAAESRIAVVHLDSGVQPERQKAHELYFRTGFRIASYHFQAPSRA